MGVVDFLEHHGVKGMKWGVRRKGGVKPAHKPSSDRRKVDELKKRGPHALSNKQLKTINDRSNLESNFRKHNPTQQQKLASQIKATIGVSGAVGLGSAIAWTQSPHGKLVIEHGTKLYKKHKATKIVEVVKHLPADAFIG